MPPACLNAGGLARFTGVTLKVRALELRSPAADPNDETSTNETSDAHLEQPFSRLAPPLPLSVPVSSRVELWNSTLQLSTCEALQSLVKDACSSWAHSPDIQVRTSLYVV